MSTFDPILGQSQAVDSLRRAYLADRLPHGLIFMGPAGVGKSTTARQLAKLFLCEEPAGDDACGRCGSCVVFDAGNHPDYHIVTKELIRFHDAGGKSKAISLSINVIRPEVVEKASRKSVMNRGKVFLIKQADLMQGPAQNALLKTLEEPSGRTLLILVTSQPGELLPTIRSRCQSVRFGTLDPAIVAREMHRRGIERTLAARSAELADGSLGVALRWIEDGIVEWAEELLGQLDALFDGQPPDDLPGWFKRAAEAYAGKQLERDELASKDQATREGLGLYLKLAAEHVRRKMPVLDERALENACDAIDAIARAENYLDSNVNTSLVFQQLAATLERRFQRASNHLRSKA